jgi:hypothetical protein
MRKLQEMYIGSSRLTVGTLFLLFCARIVSVPGVPLALGAERPRADPDSPSRTTVTSPFQSGLSNGTFIGDGLCQDTSNNGATATSDEIPREAGASNVLRKVCAATTPFDYVIGKKFVPYTPPPQPSKGECLTDTDFHTTFCRISDVALDKVGDTMASVVYSRWTPLNSNGKYLYLQRDVGSPDALIYSAENYSLVKILPDRITIDGVPDQSFDSMEGAEIRWDYTGNHPERFYFVQETKFLQYNVLDDTAHLIFDARERFPQAAILHNDVEGDSSADSRYWAWMVKGPYDGSTFPLLAIVTYDKETDNILGVMDLAKYQAYGGAYDSLPTPNMVEISPSGRKVIYHLGRCWGDESYGERPLDIGSVFDGAHAWDLDFSNPVKVSIGETHSGWAWDYEGNELFVSQNDRTDWIEARNVMTGEAINILYHGDLGWGNGFHFARMPDFIRGWILMSTHKEGENTDWGDNQLIMLEVKDQSQNPRVWRLGHTHNQYDEYYAEAFAAMSQFGDRIWWGAKWPGQNRIEAYEMTLPPKWWEDLSGRQPIESISYSTTEGVRITWHGVAGISYTIYFADSLAGTWNALSALTGAGSLMEWLDDGTETGTPPTATGVLKRFYRLGGQP